MKRYAIIVAGGSGSRMQSEVPKQFLPLVGKPILLHTLEVFLGTSLDKLILVLPEKDRSYWQEVVLPQYPQSVVNQASNLVVVAGGATRFQSVKNGLAMLPSTDGVVAVHDGVRPLITTTLINASFESAEKSGAAVVCVSLKDSMRQVQADGSNRAVDRAAFRLVQTPQSFSLSVLQQAYQQEETNLFTDDASVVEAAGHPITLIEGDYRNIKVTTPEDLGVATAFMMER